MNIFWGNRVSFKFTGQPELTSCTSLIKIVIPYVTILLCGTTREKADVEVGVHQAEGLEIFVTTLRILVEDESSAVYLLSLRNDAVALDSEKFMISSCDMLDINEASRTIFR